MTDPALARRIETTGWSTVLLGVVCVGLAAVQAVAPILLDHLAAALDANDESLRALRAACSAGAGAGAWVNGSFGLVLIVIGVAVSRRVRWSHRALTIACWASIAVLAILAKPSLAPVFAIAGEDATAGRGLIVASVVLLVAQVGAVLWFLRFWSKPEVRGEFR
jgi:hypothetical protein